MIIAVFAISMADVLLTWLGMELGLIREANPLMAAAFDISGMTAVKLTAVVVGASLLLLHRYRERVWWVRHALVMLLAVRLGVLLLHLPWLAVAMR